MKIYRLSRSFAIIALLIISFFSIAWIPENRHNNVESSTKVKPTIVLVHGAFADGSSWQKVIPILQKEGFRTVAVQNPLTSLQDDVAFVNRILEEIDGSVVLVGHSWAGMVITEAGNNPKVKSLVYVAAYAPDANESISDLSKEAYEIKKFPPVPGRDNPKISNGYIQLREETVIKHFAHDLPIEEAKVLAAVQGRFHTGNPTAKISKPAWKDKPSFYIVADEDHIISPLMEQEMARKIKATTYHLKASHAVMLSKPQEVAKVIIKASEGIE